MATGSRPSDKNLTAEQEAVRQSWQYRAIQATRGNQTKLGALVIAVCGKMTDNPPRITGSAEINEDGWVIAPFHRRDGKIENSIVGDVNYLTRSFSELADTLRLSDADRIAMFSEVKRWIRKDHRVDTTLNFTQGVKGR